MPKKRARRSAASALILRSPWTISLIRLAGTEIERASWYWLSSSGLRNSVRRISPGCTGGMITSLSIWLSFLVVVNDTQAVNTTMALYEDRMVGLAAPGHLLGSGAGHAGGLAAFPHVVVSRRVGSADRWTKCSQAGLSRRVAVIVPTHAAAAFLILSARLTGIMAGFAARRLASATSVRRQLPGPG